MLLSIVIPTHNRSLSLKKSLQALKEHIENVSEIDICVVDDCSDTIWKEQNAVTCQDYDVKYQFCSRHQGPSHARNTGLFATSGEWVAFLDDDVLIDEKWYHTLQKSIVHASVREVGIEGVTKSMGSGVWDSEVENFTGGLYLTSNIAYRRETLMRGGNFDETFKGPFAEDQELALRMQKYGQMIFNSKCIVYHQPRNVSLLSYVFNSFLRMSMLLDAEYHLFMKHRDRYHTIRHATTFWGTLGAILLKHWFTTCRRRTFQNLFRHPLQTIVLLISTILEQVTAWASVPRYLIRYVFDKPFLRHSGVNWKKTNRLWKVIKDMPPTYFFFKRSLLGSLLFPIGRKPVYNALPMLKKISPFLSAQSPELFLRVDDMFLDNTELIDSFCTCMKEEQVPFLAAVTGKDLFSKENGAQLDTITDTGGAIGLHGYNHSGTYGPYTSEILQLSFPELDNLNSRYSLGLPQRFMPIAFVPPFNAIAWDQVLHLSNTFPIVCGGPETMRFTNNSFGPVVLDNDAVYFPSCYPFYGKAVDIARPAVAAMVKQIHCPICLTVHLQAEADDAFVSLKKCISLYREFLKDWRTLYTSSVRYKNPVKEITL